MLIILAIVVPLWFLWALCVAAGSDDHHC